MPTDLFVTDFGMVCSGECTIWFKISRQFFDLCYSDLFIFISKCATPSSKQQALWLFYSTNNRSSADVYQWWCDATSDDCQAADYHCHCPLQICYHESRRRREESIHEPLNLRSTSPAMLTFNVLTISCLLLRLTTNDPVGDSTECCGSMSLVR